MTTGGLLVLAMALGLACAALALVVRRAETAHPDPADIQVRTGLAHMLIGIVAWAALISLLVTTVFSAGLILPAVTILFLGLALLPDYGLRLRSLYRSQILLAVTALLIAIVQWLNLISLFSEDLTNAQ